MCNVGKDEGNPGEEEIPDQAGVACCVCVGYSCSHEKDTGQAGYVEEEKYSNTMPVSKDKIFEFVIHSVVHAGI